MVAGAGSVKIINPWAAFFLGLMTLGVYSLFWYGMRNAELNDFGEGHPHAGKNVLHVRVLVAMLAVTAGGLLIIPPFVSELRFFRRVARAQALVGMEERLNPAVSLILLLIGYVLFPVEILYIQRHLNRLWEHAHAEDVARFG